MNKLINKIVNSIDELLSGDKKPLYIGIGFIILLAIIFGIIRGKNAANPFAVKTNSKTLTPQYTLKDFEKNTPHHNLLSNDKIQDNIIKDLEKIKKKNREKILSDSNELIIEPDIKTKKIGNEKDKSDKSRDLLIEPDGSNKKTKNETNKLRQKQLNYKPLDKTSSIPDKKRGSKPFGDTYKEKKIKIKHSKNKKQTVHKNLEIIE